MKIKKGDLVQVISGKDKGKQGKVSEVFPKDEKVTVVGVNQCVRHMKPNSKNPHGGILSQDAPIHVSKVMLVDPMNNKER